MYFEYIFSKTFSRLNNALGNSSVFELAVAFRFILSLSLLTTKLVPGVPRAETCWVSKYICQKKLAFLKIYKNNYLANQQWLVTTVVCWKCDKL